jgi:aminoglycoside phosphotransferase (APT) family kinase protein
MLRHWLDLLPNPFPATEWGLRQLELQADPRLATVLCHRDFRTGNYMVEDGRVTGVLDWEFAGWGDPHEDIGWFCARCWRFGADEREAGGLGERADFYRAYEEAGGVRIEEPLVRFWEAMAHARWTVIAAQQADRFVRGEQSLELGLTGHIVPELEKALLAMTAPKGA